MKKLGLMALAAVLVLGLVLGLGQRARANIIQKAVVYTIDGQPYEGYFAKNPGFGENQPLVLLMHD